MTAWDPVSKQPVFKNAAVRIEKLRAGTGPAPAITASRPTGGSVPPTVGGPAAEATERFPDVAPRRVATGEEQS